MGGFIARGGVWPAAVERVDDNFVGILCGDIVDVAPTDSEAKHQIVGLIDALNAADSGAPPPEPTPNEQLMQAADDAMHWLYQFAQRHMNADGDEALSFGQQLEAAIASVRGR